MSSRRKRMVVLIDSADVLDGRFQLLPRMFPAWDAAGLEVSVASEQQPPIAADIAFMHVDLSVVPDHFRRIAQRYPTVINGQVLDIRKRRFSRLLIDRDGPDPGPVIVKTDCNYLGWPEHRRQMWSSPLGPLFRAHRYGDLIARKLRSVEAHRSWKRRRVMQEYLVYPQRAEVPKGIWENPHLIVERFAAERRGSMYCCRHWLFLGRAEVHKMTMSPHPMVKAASSHTTLTEPVPQALRDVRQSLGFDFGKFDYGLVGDEVVLYDVNRTPGASADPRNHTHTVSTLAPGLFDLIP